MKLSQRVKDSLDECRMLVLGVQVLLGFAYRGFFEPRFDGLSPLVRACKLGSLALQLFVMAFLLVPVAWHRIASQGEDTPQLEGITRTAATTSLAPFAVALGIEIAVAGLMTHGPVLGAASGAVITAFALFAWYVLPRAQRRRDLTKESEMEPTKLSKKIDHALIECRVVLPGSQALLGFQLITTLMTSFTELPPASKIVHFASLASVAISVVLLMFPAAYHRIAENGDFTERLLSKASAAIIAALAFLAVGMSGDFYVVVQKVTGSAAIAGVAGGATLLVFAIAWFGSRIAARSSADGRALAPHR